MAKLQHTPGPWKVLRIPEDLSRAPSVYGADGRSVCSTGNARSRSFGQSEADARLIAAAPDLLKVSKATAELLELVRPVFGLLDTSAGGTEYAEGIETILATIKMVIAKAEGSDE